MVFTALVGFCAMSPGRNDANGRHCERKVEAEGEETHDECGRECHRRFDSDGTENRDSAELAYPPSAQTDWKGGGEHDQERGAHGHKGYRLEAHGEQSRDVAPEHEGVGDNGHQQDRPELSDASTRGGEGPGRRTAPIRDGDGGNRGQRHAGDQNEKVCSTVSNTKAEARQQEPCRRNPRHGEDTRGENAFEEGCDDRRAKWHPGRRQDPRAPDALPNDVENELVPQQTNGERGEQPPPGRRKAEPAEQDAEPRHRDEQITENQEKGEGRIVGPKSA